MDRWMDGRVEMDSVGTQSGGPTVCSPEPSRFVGPVNCVHLQASSHLHVGRFDDGYVLPKIQKKYEARKVCYDVLRIYPLSLELMVGS